MNIESKILLPHIYVLAFDTRYELCMSFVRIQEFYESPKFKGRYFTLEQYIDYWSKEFGKGSFTYPSVWNGFNVPGNILNKWLDKFDDDLRKREEEILEKVDNLIQKEQGFIYPDNYEKTYIIGTHKENGIKYSNQIIKHELAHSMYCLYPEYKKRCKKLLKSIPEKDYKDTVKLLTEMGYGKNVMDDELQAYFSTSDNRENNALFARKDFVCNFRCFKKKLSE